MNTEILGVVAQVALMVILAYPLGDTLPRFIKERKPGRISWLLLKESFIKYAELTLKKK